MAHIKVFKASEADQANEFIDSVDLCDGRVELQDGQIYVFYHPQVKPEELEAQKVRSRIRQAEESLVEAKLHSAFLGVTDIGDEEKIKSAKESNDKEIKNIENRIQLFKSWEILKS